MSLLGKRKYQTPEEELEEQTIASDVPEDTQTHNSPCCPSERGFFKTKKMQKREQKSESIETTKISTKVVKKEKLTDEAANPIQKEKKIYHCPIQGCNVTFEKFQQLGGHKSKAHPGCSASYIRKLEVRTNREGERDILKASKKRWQ